MILKDLWSLLTSLSFWLGGTGCHSPLSEAWERAYEIQGFLGSLREKVLLGKIMRCIEELLIKWAHLYPVQGMRQVPGKEKMAPDSGYQTCIKELEYVQQLLSGVSWLCVPRHHHLGIPFKAAYFSLSFMEMLNKLLFATASYQTPFCCCCCWVCCCFVLFCFLITMKEQFVF